MKWEWWIELERQYAITQVRNKETWTKEDQVEIKKLENKFIVTAISSSHIQIFFPHMPEQKCTENLFS